MSTFPGILSEIDNISVDRFDGQNLRSTAYFLSHRHFDHMEGLLCNAFRWRLQNHPDIFLYCSPVTKIWLGNDLKGLDHKIKELPINSAVTLDIPTSAPGKAQLVTVTALPAGHCPGSVMFLFNYDSMHILYTGDIRMNVTDLEKMTALKDVSIDTLYLDTTFYSPVYAYLPSRDESMTKLVDFCKNWLNLNKQNVIDIRRPGTIGIEFVYITLRSEIGTSVHVSDVDWENYARIPELASAITRDESKTRIHACVGARQSKERDAFSKCHQHIDQEHVRSVKLCTFHATNLEPEDDILSYHQENDLYKLIYSSHCSHNELREIVSMLSPRRLVPCVVSQQMNATEEGIIDCLRRKSSRSPVVSSFESTLDLSPLGMLGNDGPPMQNCSQSSTQSMSSNEDFSAKAKGSCPISSHRYAVHDSSDDELSSTPPKSSDKSGSGWACAQDDTEDRPWEKYMQAKKKMRTD